MSTARLAGKKIDDVLYPNIEPYKTGMLKVSNLQFSHKRFYYINSIILHPENDFAASNLHIFYN